VPARDQGLKAQGAGSVVVALVCSATVGLCFLRPGPAPCADRGDRVCPPRPPIWAWWPHCSPRPLRRRRRRPKPDPQWRFRRPWRGARVGGLAVRGLWTWGEVRSLNHRVRVAEALQAEASPWVHWLHSSAALVVPVSAALTDAGRKGMAAGSRTHRCVAPSTSRPPTADLALGPSTQWQALMVEL
jgi:hypothetical protein